MAMDDEVFVIEPSAEPSPNPSHEVNGVDNLGMVKDPEDIRDQLGMVKEHEDIQDALTVQTGRRLRINSDRSRPRFNLDETTTEKKLRPVSLGDAEYKRRSSGASGKLYPGLRRVSTFSMPGQVGYHQIALPAPKSREGSIKSYQVSTIPWT